MPTDSLLSFADVAIGFALACWAFFSVEAWLIARSEREASDDEAQNAHSSDAL